MKREFDVAIGILTSRHRNKVNTEKQGRDKLFYVGTKISTQGREVLSRHKNLVAKENIYNSKRLCRNIIMKLQQEIRLLGDKTLSR